MKNNIWKLFSVGILAALFISCGTEPEKTDYDISYNSELLPEVKTGDIIFNSNNAAVATTLVTNKSNVKIKEQGILYSTESNLNLVNSTILRPAFEENGSAKVLIEGLETGSVYYYRSYAYTNEGISYGEIKHFTASNQVLERKVIHVTDFDSKDCINDFTPTKLAGDGRPWYIVPMKVDGLPNYMLASSSLDVPSLFANKVAFTGDADNILQYEADFTGKTLPAVSIYAIDVDGFLVGADRNSSIEVLASPTPITTMAEANAAEKVGKINFTPKIWQASQEFLLPARYSNAKCYIALRNSAVFENSIGVLLGEFVTSSLIEAGK